MFFCGLAALLLLAPLYKAGNRPLPLLLLELGAVALLFAIVIGRRAPIALPRLLVIALAILLVYPLVQLIPLPEALWRMVPGHEPYAVVLDRFAAGGSPGPWRAISVIPSATEYAWLALLPPLAVLLAVLHLSVEQVARLLLLMAALAGAESVLGLLQIGPGGGGALFLGNEEPGQRAAIGTFVNRNHFAAMLAMMLPVIVGVLAYGFRPGRRRSRRGSGPVPSELIAKRALLFAAAVLILVCLAFTKSRAGLASGLVGLAACGVVLVRAQAASAGEARVHATSGIVTVLVAAAAIVALAIGMGPVIAGLESGALHASADFRAAIYVATMRAALEFLPFGSGLGTFAGVFPRFQIGDAGGTIDFAHNDYLQVFMELGAAGVVLVLLLLAAWALRIRTLLLAHGGRSFTLLQLGAGLGMLPLILHSAFDFALHMPANAVWFAALAGVLFHRSVGPQDPRR